MSQVKDFGDAIDSSNLRGFKFVDNEISKKEKELLKLVKVAKEIVLKEDEDLFKELALK